MSARNIRPDDERRRTAYASHLRGTARRLAIGAEYVRLLAAGLRPFAIADMLGLSVRTVKNYGSIYRRALRDGNP